MSNLMKVSSTPHIRDNDSTARIMLRVIIALLPAAGFGIWNFGLKALFLMLVCMVSCMGFEWLFCIITKRKNSIRDISCIVTGLLLAMNLPVSVPWGLAMIGSFFAIVVVKMLFGGLGQNFMNPALGARCFLLISFSKLMTNFNYDTFTGATPLAVLKEGGNVVVQNMIIGREAGTIGETSMIAIVIGGIFLIATGVIDLTVTATYLVSFSVFILLFAQKGFNLYYLSAQLAGGGLMLGAFFMATDYATRPITRKGQVIYGIFIGILTGIFRLFGPSAEGVSYAIIIGNLIVPLIEKISVPRCFGKGGERR